MANITWQQIKSEARKRWVILGAVGVYLLVAILFAILIYGFGWDQTATRWAARVFPLPAGIVNGEPQWLSTYYRRLGVFEYYAARVEAEQPGLIPQDKLELQQRVFDELAEIMLLKQEAHAAGIQVTEAEIMASYDKLAEAHGGTEDFQRVIADFYNLTPFQFAKEFIPEQIYRDKIQEQLFTQLKVRHIVVEDEGQARQVLDKTKAGEDFQELAKQFSQDLTTRSEGGDLGWLRRGQFTQAFEDAAFTLAAGQLSQELVKTDFGYHIIKVEERRDGPVSDQSFPIWLESLRDQAKIRQFILRSTPQATNPAPDAVPAPS